MWTMWKIKMMSWWHKIWGKPFLGRFHWILGEVSRRDKIWDRYIVSYLIYPNPKIENAEQGKKSILISYLRNILSWRKLSMGRYWEGQRRLGKNKDKDSASSSDQEGDCIGMYQERRLKETYAWRENKLLELQRMKAKKIADWIVI